MTTAIRLEPVYNGIMIQPQIKTIGNAEKAYQMLGNENLWSVALRCHQLLKEAGVPHSIAGGVAVCLHGYQRNTVDLDLLVRPEDSGLIRSVMTSAGFEWHAEECEFRTPDGIAVQFLIAGEKAGRGMEISFPDPAVAESIETIENLPVLRLSKLIESKLASGTGSIRRTHRDFADVVELIAIRNLDSSFARHLHKSLRVTFRKLVDNARGSN